MKLLLLTGGIACGKSTVANYIRKRGFTIVDSDVIARQVVLPHHRAWNNIKKEFGDKYFREDLTLDRPKLGTDIFSNPETRLAINRCTHPAVYREIGVQVAHAYFRGSRLVVVDIPLLFETRAHLHPAFSTTPVAVVAVPRDVQKARLMSRDGLTDTMAESRIESQMSTVDKVMLGEAVIENDGTVEDTEAKVDRLIHEVLRGNRIPPNPARVALLAGVSKSWLGKVVDIILKTSPIMRWMPWNWGR